MKTHVVILAMVILMAGASVARADRQSDLKTFGDYANTIHRQLASLSKIQALDKARENNKAFRDAYRDEKLPQALKLVQANAEELDRVSGLVVKRAEAFLHQAGQLRDSKKEAEAQEALKQAQIGKDLAVGIMLIRDEHYLLCGLTSKFLGDSRGAIRYFQRNWSPQLGSQFAKEYQQMKAIASQQLAELKR